MEKENKEKAKPKRTYIFYKILGILILIPIVLSGIIHLYAEIKLYTIKKKIHSEGLPFTPDELEKWYKYPKGKNGADKILKAIKLYNNEIDDTGYEKLPIVGMGEKILRGQKLTCEILQVAEKYLNQNKKCLAALFDAADFDKCRYPDDLSKPFEHHEYYQKLRESTLLLRLNTLYSASREDSENAAKSIITSFAIARSLNNEPLMISLLVKHVITGLAYRSLETALTLNSFNAGQLKSIETAINKTESKESLYNAFIGERCLTSTIYSMPLAIEEDAILNIFIEPTNELEKFYFKIHKLSGLKKLDEIYALNFNSKLISLAEKSPLVRLHNVSKLPPVHPFYAYHFKRIPLESLSKTIKISIMQLIYLRITRAAIIIERYKEKTGKLPENLNQVIPEYTKIIPIDPCSNKPVKYLQSGGYYKVYSIGIDQVDNGGNLLEQRPPYTPGYDIGLTTEPEKKKRGMNFTLPN